MQRTPSELNLTPIWIVISEYTLARPCGPLNFLYFGAGKNATVVLFPQLGQGDIALLTQDYRELRPQKDEIVFQKGAPSNGFYIVAHGQIKPAFSSAQGAEKMGERTLVRTTGEESFLHPACLSPVRALA